ncbi:MAG: phosphate signaling complex protein PhoU [Spirochaetota bacterium]
METRQQLDRQLGDLYQLILKMGALVEEALNKAVEALKQRDLELAQSVIRGDDAIDELHMQVEDRSTQIIALEQPVATDLRELITATKIGADLERIGDHARHIARVVETLPTDLVALAMPEIESMARIGTSMVRDGLTAFVDQDAEKARQVAARDDDVDIAHRKLYQTLVDIMRDRPEWIEHGVKLMFMNRYLERLGDHVTNICEWVVFAKTGEHLELNK